MLSCKAETVNFRSNLCRPSDSTRLCTTLGAVESPERLSDDGLKHAKQQIQCKAKVSDFKKER